MSASIGIIAIVRYKLAIGPVVKLTLLMISIQNLNYLHLVVSSCTKHLKCIDIDHGAICLELRRLFLTSCTLEIATLMSACRQDFEL